MDEPVATDLLAAAAARRPGAPALRVGNDEWTYAELDYAASEVAGRIPAGERVAFRAEMSAATVAAVWGIPRGGGIAVPLDPTLDADRASERAVAFGATLGWPQHTEALRSDREPAADATAFVLATSGSSGEPRGAIITFGNIRAAAFGSQLHLGSRSADVWLLALPLHHVAGLAILWRAAHDGSAVVLHERFEPSRFAAALGSEASWTSVVPTMLQRLLDQPSDWSRVRGVLVGGAHASEEVLDRAHRAGLPALATYGMTETTAQICTVQPGRLDESRGTVGLPLPDVVVSIDGPPGDPGTIVVSGPTVSPGYLDEPPRSGPFFTSDVGTVDAAGRLVVLGRRDDVIISGGENVYPQRVEAALRAIPGVSDAFVCGLPDPEWGERVVAVVAPDPAGRAGSNFDPTAILRLLAGQLPRHEIPKEVRFVADLPKLGSGKTDRGAARQLVAEGS